MAQTSSLGKLTVFKQGFGAMSVSKGFYGDGPSFQVGVETVQAALKGGVNVLSTASFYGDGANELVIGKAIEGFPRKDVVICSKWGPNFPDGAPPFFDASRAGARKMIDIELKRLGVDYIDVWVLRSFGKLSQEQLEETFGAVKELIEEGKVKHAGVSELSADELRAAHKIVPLTLCELEWSLFARDCEKELVPTCRELGIGILAYAPMGRGLLTGQVDHTKLDANDFRTSASKGTYYSPENANANAKLVAKVKALADAKGCSSGQLAIAWVHSRGTDVVAIPGTKTPKRVPENLKAASIELTQKDMDDLEAAIPHDQVAGARYVAH